MENRFKPNPEEQGWGAYVAPPVLGPSQTGLCTNVRGMLPDLLENDGAVRPEMATAIFGHLAVCSGCAREYDEMQRVVTHLQSLPLAEPPTDYSGLIMRRIQTQAETINRVIQAEQSGPTDLQAGPNTTVSEHAVIRRTPRLEMQISSTQGLAAMRRLSLGAAFSAAIAFFVSSDWGRQMLGVNVSAAVEWIGQVGDMIRKVPMLGWIVGLIFSILAHTGGLLEETYRALGPTAVQGLVVDIVLGALACFFMARRQRIPGLRG